MTFHDGGGSGREEVPLINTPGARLMKIQVLVVATLFASTVNTSLAQTTTRARPTTRAESLYVSNKWEDHPPRDFARDMAAKARTDSIYRARTRGVVDYQKITYRSSVGDMDIPAYVIQPLNKRGPRRHAALIWVHGGVHGSWTEMYWPFVREAVERGYVVIAPEYRGSTGYGRDFHNAIDYGGHELDDVLTGGGNP